MALTLFPWLTLPVLLGAAVPWPPDRPALDNHFLAATERVERLAFPAGAVVRSAAADGLAQSITVELRSPAGPVVQALTDQLSAASLCPAVTAVPRGVRLTCTERLMDAQLRRQKGNTFLEIRLLRGLPTTGDLDAPPHPRYPATVVGVSERSPDAALVNRAEKALERGHILDAAALYQKLLGTPWFSLAQLRLGDCALAQGDWAKAVAWYQRVAGSKAFGRVALSRQCEMQHSCLNAPARMADAFASFDIPEPVRGELELRYARALLFMGRQSDATGVLLARMSRVGPNATCEMAPRLCRRLTLLALRDSTTERMPEALALYASLPNMMQGPLAVDLATAAATRAEDLGAPETAGQIMATVTPEVPRAALEEHLLRTARLYLAAQQPARAEAIVDFARTRVPATHLAAQPWKDVLEQLPQGRPERVGIGMDRSELMEAELARALVAMAHAKTVPGTIKNPEPAP